MQPPLTHHTINISHRSLYCGGIQPAADVPSEECVIGMISELEAMEDVVPSNEVKLPKVRYSIFGVHMLQIGSSEEFFGEQLRANFSVTRLPLRGQRGHSPS